MKEFTFAMYHLHTGIGTLGSTQHNENAELENRKGMVQNYSCLFTQNSEGKV